jgi:hypothetical protein
MPTPGLILYPHVSKADSMAAIEDKISLWFTDPI